MRYALFMRSIFRALFHILLFLIFYFSFSSRLSPPTSFGFSLSCLLFKLYFFRFSLSFSQLSSNCCHVSYSFLCTLLPITFSLLLSLYFTPLSTLSSQLADTIGSEGNLLLDRIAKSKITIVPNLSYDTKTSYGKSMKGLKQIMTEHANTLR